MWAGLVRGLMTVTNRAAPRSSLSSMLPQAAYLTAELSPAPLCGRRSQCRFRPRSRLSERFDLDVLIPDEPDRTLVDRVIYDELTQGRVVGEHAKPAGLRRLGLLGARWTMQEDFYRSRRCGATGCRSRP